MESEIQVNAKASSPKLVLKARLDKEVRRFPVESLDPVAVRLALSNKFKLSADSFDFSMDEEPRRVHDHKQVFHVQLKPFVASAKPLAEIQPVVVAGDAAPVVVDAQQPAEAVLREGQRIALMCLGSRAYLQVKEDGTVDGLGAGSNALACQFDVVEKHGCVLLRSASQPRRFLRIGMKFRFDACGMGGKFTFFKVLDHGRNTISLSSAYHEGAGQAAYMGVLPEGGPKPADKTRTGAHGRFRVVLLQDAPTNIERLLLKQEKKQEKKEKAEKKQKHNHVDRKNAAKKPADDETAPSAPIFAEPLVAAPATEEADAKAAKKAERKAVKTAHKEEKREIKLAAKTEKAALKEEKREAKLAAKAEKKAASSDSEPAVPTSLGHGDHIVLRSVASKANLSIREDGSIDGHGSDDAADSFEVIANEDGFLFRSVAFPKKFLRITKDGELDGRGMGGVFTVFSVKDHGEGKISLQSAFHLALGKPANVGILHDGTPKAPFETRFGPCGKFVVVHLHSDSVSSPTPTSTPTPSTSTTSAPRVAVLTSVVDQHVFLVSRATGKLVRILPEGVVDAFGDASDPSSARFIVEQRENGHVSLKLASADKKYLRVMKSLKVDCKGAGGPLTLFDCVHSSDGTVSFRSVALGEKNISLGFDSKGVPTACPPESSALAAFELIRANEH